MRAAVMLMTVLLLALSSASRSVADTRPQELDTTIRYLIDYVAASDITFQRNLSRHSATEAAQHIDRKYLHFIDEIDTPEKFIELCASRSLVTGRPYLAITPEGEELPASEWLNSALAAYRSRGE